MTKIYLHTLPIRIWHWINAAVVFILIITGAVLRSPDAIPTVSYSYAVSIHKYAGFVMSALFLFWLIYSLLSGSLRRNYLIRIEDIKGMPRQVFYYAFGIFKGTINPFKASIEQKFNPMQKLAYGSVMCVFTPLIVLTGILFSDILFFVRPIRFVGGIRVIDALHVATAYGFLIYLGVHFYMSTLGSTPTAHAKAMITGYEEEHEDHSEREQEVPNGDKSES